MMSQKLNIIVVGASGKMGQTLIQEISNDSGLELIAALDQENCPLMNHDAGERLGLKTNVLISSELNADLKADIMIDFTRPEASLGYLDLCKKNKIKYVLGTTGFSDQEKQVIKSAANEIEGDVRYEVCDVSDWTSVKSMVESAASAQNGLDVMCANAGAFPQTKMIDMDPSEWDQVMAVNLKSSFLCVKASIPFFELHLREQDIL